MPNTETDNIHQALTAVGQTVRWVFLCAIQKANRRDITEEDLDEMLLRYHNEGIAPDFVVAYAKSIVGETPPKVGWGNA